MPTLLDDPFSPAIFDDPAVPLRDVERDLTRRRNELQAPGASPAQLAAMSNLVIYCRTRDDAVPVLAEIENITASHPARVLLVVADDHAEPTRTEARPLVWVRETEGRSRVHNEAIVLTAAGRECDHLPYAVRSLLIGDIPMNLWWATPEPPAMAGPRLFELAEHAQQVIYDSVGWTDPARGVAAMANWVEQFERSQCSRRMVRVASDLNWRRLKFWRRLLSQALDPAAAPEALEGITEVAVDHGPHGVIQAWELLSWLASRLNWKVRSGRARGGVELDWQADAPHGRVELKITRLPEGPAAVTRVRVNYTANALPCRLTMQADGPTRLSAQPDCGGVEARTIAVQPLNLVELVARQLSDRQPDPVFRESLEVARVFAQRLLG